MSDVLRVKTLTFENQPFSAYNLEVAEDHTFFIGAERAWVHNASTCELLIEKGLIGTYKTAEEGFEVVGGHHVLSKALFKGIDGLSYTSFKNLALSITEGGLKELKLAIEHTNVSGSLSRIQQDLYQEFAKKGNKVITLAQAKAIEIEALVKGGISRANAEELLGKAVSKIEDALKKLGKDPETLELHIPYLR